MDVKSEIRVLSLFELFAQVGQPMALTELAEKLGIPTSSCFNLVRGIEQRGYIYPVKARGALYPTRRLFDLAKAVLDHDVISPSIRERLASLRDEVRETVCLASRRDEDVVYLDVEESPQAIRFMVSVGDTRDVHSNSTGKAILSTMDAVQRARLLQKLKFRRHTARTLRSAAELEEDIAKGIKRGWFSNEGESTPDALAIAIPTRIGSIWYGVAIVGPRHRMEPALKKHLASLRAAVASISEEGA